MLDLTTGKDKENDYGPVWFLYLQNYFTYMLIEIFISAFMVGTYAVVLFTMQHRECKFDRTKYDPDYAKVIKEEDLPNVATSVIICFIAGFLLHVLLFAVNVFYEPYLFYYKNKRHETNDKDGLDDEDNPIEQLDYYLR